MIHMAETFGSETAPDGFGWYCRCGVSEAGGYLTRNEARSAGDAHLAVANAPPEEADDG